MKQSLHYSSNWEDWFSSKYLAMIMKKIVTYEKKTKRKQWISFVCDIHSNSKEFDWNYSNTKLTKIEANVFVCKDGNSVFRNLWHLDIYLASLRWNLWCRNKQDEEKFWSIFILDEDETILMNIFLILIENSDKIGLNSETEMF